MLDFEEEITRFKPSMEVGEVEEAIVREDLTDMTDLMVEFLKNGTEQEAPEPLHNWENHPASASEAELPDPHFHSAHILTPGCTFLPPDLLFPDSLRIPEKKP